MIDLGSEPLDFLGEWLCRTCANTAHLSVLTFSFTDYSFHKTYFLVLLLALLGLRVGEPVREALGALVGEPAHEPRMSNSSIVIQISTS